MRFNFTPRLKVTDINNLAGYLDYSESMRSEYASRQQAELALITDNTSFDSNGFCFVCGRKSVFQTDFLYSDPNHIVAGKPIPNWRERLVCSACKLNNRVRGSIQFLEQKLKAKLTDNIYVTEQLTPLYAHLKNNYPRLQGSEYLGEKIPFGSTDEASGIRNESITKLTFETNTFNYILSFDVFEHVPEYPVALKECFRCLKKGGALLFSVPFNKFSEGNLVRAKVDKYGSIAHILEPEYHGDPTNSAGCLCFYHFGWELLEQLRETGFRQVHAHFFWSEKLGYLGGEQILFSASK